MTVAPKFLVALVSVSLLGASVSFSSMGRAQAAPATQAPLTAAQAHAFATNVSDKVIVVFRNQVAAEPESSTRASSRNAAVNTVQRPVLNELTMTRAQHVKPFHLINSVAAVVSPAEAQRLAENPAVAAVVPDEALHAATPSALPTNAAPRAVAAHGITPPPGVCAPPGQVQLNPEAIINIHAATQDGTGPSAQSLGYTGAGVKVAFIAGGIDENNPEFIRPNGQHAFVDFQDFSNTGSNTEGDALESFIDAGSIASQGSQTYDLSGWGNATYNRPCLIRVLGVAPGASLVGLDVRSDAIFSNSSILEAIDYAVTVDHVDVLNESFEFAPFPSAASIDLMKMANDAAVAAGVTVTVASGDVGSPNTIDSPGSDSKVITVGATTTFRGFQQGGFGAAAFLPVTGWEDNNISSFSSSGFAQDGSTIDLVAPGHANWTLCTPDPVRYPDCTDAHGAPSALCFCEGTSESAPLTAGVAALVIQAFRATHGGARPSPAAVKRIITSTAQDVAAPAEQQGAGMLDAYQAVVAAEQYPGAHVATGGDAILTSASQLHATGQPGAAEVLSDTITNTGSKPVTVSLAGRALGAYRSVARTTVTLPGPVASVAYGSAARVQFTVPSGVARLDTSITNPGTPPYGYAYYYRAVAIFLVDPEGKFAASSSPGGAGNYGDVQVSAPIPGTWTALVFSVVPVADGGTAGPVLFGARIADWVSFGQLSSRSLTLAPGAARTVTLTARTPANPGDRSGAIVLTSSSGGPDFAAVTTVPVTLRALVPSPSPTSTFRGTLTGGNGTFDPTATASYQVRIPAGLPVLDAQITLPNSGSPFEAALIDPATEEAATTAVSSLYSFDATGNLSVLPERGVELHVVNPDAGVWTLIINWYEQVSGTALRQPFTVVMSRIPPAASAPLLPDSAGTRLPQGKPVTVQVRVTNRGRVPEEYFIDSRLDRSTVYQLSALTSASVAVPVPFTSALPEYFVPSHTTSITVKATAPAPIYFDYFWYYGDPDLVSNSVSRSPSGTFSAPAIADGAWGVSLMQQGLDGRRPVPPVTATTSMTATSLAFDPAVVSPTGDLWLVSTDPFAQFTPYIVNPGQTVSIPVTITPTAAPGTTVRGTLFLDDTSWGVDAYDWPVGFVAPVPVGSDVAAFPYEYTVK